MNTDYLVVGSGVIGISIALELKRRFGDASVTVIDKEPECALHASGRNSGVLHAGFYYTADSLKARFTREGNAYLTSYCEEKRIPINKCGKLVVARDEGEHASLDILLSRGAANGVELHDISEDEAREIEPRVLTCGRALFSPATSSVDPVTVVKHLEQDARDAGVRFHYGTRYQGRTRNGILTSGGEFQCGYLVNAAGLYADSVARDFSFSADYSILPFKGLYLYSSEPEGAVRTNIYPVPDLRNPFLGVHFTVTVDGHVKVGPTAIPALWREQYRGVENFSFSEFSDITWRGLGLILSSDFDFKKLTVEELRKYSRSRMVELASSLLSGVRRENYQKWARPGIRAQLLHVRERRLEMDFVLEGDGASMHVLNAVSPGFTCCMPFARHVCDRIEHELG